MKNNEKRAQDLYNTVANFLTEHKLRFEKNDEELSMSFSGKLEDLEIPINVTIDSEAEIIQFLSPLPFLIDPNYENEMAVAVCEVNSNLFMGNFDYSHDLRLVVFRLEMDFHDSLIGKDLLNLLFYATLKIVDDYNDKFLIMQEKRMTIEQILACLK